MNLSRVSNSPKNLFQLSAGLHLETMNTNSLNSAFGRIKNIEHVHTKHIITKHIPTKSKEERGGGYVNDEKCKNISMS